MLQLLRVVTLASATGKYGGPFDTACRQVIIADDIGYAATLFASYLPGDRPESKFFHRIRTQFVQARMIIPKVGFASVASFRSLLELKRAIRRSDIVHISMAREIVPLVAIALTLLYQKRCVVQSHGMLTARTSLLHQILDLAIRPLVRKASSIIALTEVEADDLRKWIGPSAPPITTLGNPLPRDLRSEVRSRPASDQAVFIARLHKRKRVNLFLSAASTSNQKGWPHQFLIVGPDGGDLVLVEQESIRLPNTSYLGAVPAEAVSELVAQAGVFVLTSQSEPWGNVLAIALASGVPVIVPESAALARVIDRFHAGKVLKDGDANGLSEAIHSILSDEELYEQLSAGAIRLASLELDEEHQKRVLGRLYKVGTQPTV